MEIGLGLRPSLPPTEDSESQRPEGKSSADRPVPEPLTPLLPLVISEGQMHRTGEGGGGSDQAIESCVGQPGEILSQVGGQLVGRNGLLEKSSTGLQCPGSRSPHHFPGSRTISGISWEQPKGSKVSASPPGWI